MRFFVTVGVATLWAASNFSAAVAAPGSCIHLTHSQAAQKLTDPPLMSRMQLQQIAKAITVKVQSARVTGSGVLIGQRGRTYYVLTNAHNLLGTDLAEVQTSDGAIHGARRARIASLGKNDLAVLAFTSDRTYQLATWSDQLLAKQGLAILAAGFEFDRSEISIDSGRVTQLLEQPLRQGYQLGYHSRLRQGMSGGPILDLAGQLVGVNAMSAYPILNSAYVFVDGSRPSWATVKLLRKSNWGIPIHPYATCLQQIF